MQPHTVFAKRQTMFRMKRETEILGRSGLVEMQNLWERLAQDKDVYEEWERKTKRQPRASPGCSESAETTERAARNSTYACR